MDGKGVLDLFEWMGYEVAATLWLDSSSAKATCMRDGVGKVKHLSVRQLWLQEQAGAGELWHTKIPRLDNLSDCLTHHFTKAEAELHFPKMGCDRPAL